MGYVNFLEGNISTDHISARPTTSDPNCPSQKRFSCFSCFSSPLWVSRLPSYPKLAPFSPGDTTESCRKNHLSGIKFMFVYHHEYIYLYTPGSLTYQNDALEYVSQFWVYIYMCYISGGILLFITCLGLVLTFLPIFDQVLKFTILNSREVVDQPPENNILDLPPTQQQSPFFHFTTQLQTSLELQDVRMRTSSKGIKLKASPPSNSQHHQDCYIEPSFATLTGWWGRSQNIYRCHWIYA